MRERPPAGPTPRSTIRGCAGSTRRRTASPFQPFRPCPPDGPAAGVIARRALERGAWIAPANQTLVGIAALDAAFPADAAQLAAAINPIGRDGLNFAVLDALTLSEDADTQPINVRRLMSLLRRLALKQGAQFVFEPNSDALRRAIDHRFRNWLGTLFARGLGIAGCRRLWRLAECRNRVLDGTQRPAFGLLIVGQRGQAQGDAEG